MPARYPPGARGATPPRSGRGEPAVLRQLRQDGLGLEVALRERVRGPGVARVVGAHRLEGRHDVVQAAEGEQAFAGREDLPERGVLRDDRAAGGEVAGAAVAEPAASQAD